MRARGGKAALWLAAVVLWTGALVQGYPFARTKLGERLVAPLTVGEAFPLRLLRLDGEGVYSISPCSVVIVADPNCSACKRLADELAARLGGEDTLDAVWVSLSAADATRAFAAGHALPLAIMGQIAGFERRANSLHRLGIAGTPTTVFMGSEGTITSVRTGANLGMMTSAVRQCKSTG